MKKINTSKKSLVNFTTIKMLQIQIYFWCKKKCGHAFSKLPTRLKKVMTWMWTCIFPA